MKKSNDEQKPGKTLWNKVKSILITVVVSTVIFIFLAELLLYLFIPQPYFYPRLRYSEAYRKMPYKNVTIEHCVPPHKRYYTTNEYHHRGKPIPISNKYDKPNIVVLGDSFTFGIGVNDGDEYASVIADQLKPEYNVINTGVGGWGLTQQIRRFYEFGQLYHPKIVFLLFCGNDPEDNMRDPCTKIEDDRFVFFNFDKGDDLFVYRMNKYLSNSIIQKSNLYMLLSKVVWPKIKKQQRNLMMASNKMDSGQSGDGGSIDEQYYNELLTPFAEDLHDRNIKFYFASVNYFEGDEKKYQLEDFSSIRENVMRLDSLGYLTFVDINRWFTLNDFAQSPVYHYDRQWNQVLGKNLSKYLLTEMAKEKEQQAAIKSGAYGDSAIFVEAQ